MNKGYFTRWIRFSFTALFLVVMVGCGATTKMTFERCLQGPFGGASIVVPQGAPLDEIISLTCGGTPGEIRYELTDTLGLEQLTALEELNLNGTFPSVDLLQNIKLTSLSLNSHSLTDLDLSQNTALESLTLVGRQIMEPPRPGPLGSLDLSQNTALIDIALYGEWELENINLPSTSTLQSFICRDCDLTNIDLSQNTGLTNVELLENQQLQSIDFSNNTALTHVRLSGASFSDVSSLLGLTNLQVVSLYRAGNIPCAQLDALEAIVSEQLFRPDTCVE